jgi:predicted CXXCH cytochrome family protein
MSLGTNAGRAWHNLESAASMSGKALRIVVLASGIAALSSAQGLDTVLLRENAGTQRFSIIDQIPDPKERHDFLKLYGAREPQRRRNLAESFIATHPQSWVLAQAYEIAAKACIDLNDDAPALQFSRESLRLLPENPLLLVPLAGVQVQLGKFADAEAGARDALEYLDQFDRPAAISTSQWPAIQAELKASSYFTLGRVAIAEGLKAAEPEKEQRMHQAEEHLLRARALRTDDPEIAYVLGLTELSLAKPNDAAFYFVKAQSKSGPVQAKALENLRRIFKLSNLAAGVSFEAFVESVERSGGPTPAPTGSFATKSANAAISAYAGSESCKPCHSAIYASWQETGMGRMFRPYQPEDVIGDFRANNQFSDGTGAVVARMSVQHDRCYFAVRDASGGWRTYPVDYTIGSKWQQAYATRLPDGDIHVFPVQYSAITGKWINYWKLIDPPSSPRAEVTSFNQLTSATNYQINCAPCHTSQLRLSKPGSLSGHDYEFREGSINCEMCHGPGQNHILAMTSGKGGDNTKDHGTQNFRGISGGAYVAICGQCHAQSAVRQPGLLGEVNYPAQGTTFPPTYVSRPYGELARRAFYKDGRFRETTFIAEAFRRSACFRKGQAHCGNCHQPHAPDSSSNPTSLKFLGKPDQMCLQCHNKFVTDISSHTHHPATAEASRCAACHMPRIMNSLMFKARTHQIDDIPNAEMTERFGPDESPNACLLCHTEKDAQWVKLRLQAW